MRFRRDDPSRLPALARAELRRAPRVSDRVLAVRSVLRSRALAQHRLEGMRPHRPHGARPGASGETPERHGRDDRMCRARPRRRIDDVTSQRMRSADAAWLHMDRPANLMVINSLEWFDTVPDWDAVRLAILERIVGRFERFRQVPESGLLTGARWAVDPSYEPAAHFHRHTLPAPGDWRALSALAGDLATAPLDHRRPLWEVHEIEGYGSGAALLIRVHHAVADGMSLARVMLSASDEAAEPGPGFGEAAHHGSPRASVLSRGLGAALHPRMTAARGLVDAGALAKLLLPGSEASSALQGSGHIVPRVAWSDPVALWRVRNTARAYDVTINDVLIAALSGALRRQLLRAGRDPERLHALIPFNLRPLDEPLSPELGNRFGLVLADLPVELGHPVERVWEAARCMQAIKHSDEGAIS